MKVFHRSSRRLGVLVGAAAVLVAGGVGLAVASTTAAPPTNAVRHGRGINEYGMTQAFYKGTRLSFTYTRGFYCDRHVRSTASSKCEAGANFKRPPARHHDPLYITVPLGFTQPMNMLECPDTLICVDHPGTIDLRRLEPALKPLYPQLTKKQLTQALSNFAVPGHDHFITDVNRWKPEWWPVKIIGVTNAKTYHEIRGHRSYAFIKHLYHHHNKHVTSPIPTNLFLYFGVAK